MIVLVQARLNSKRFPNKMLKKIFGKPLIWYVLKSIKKSKKVKKIVVSTSKNKSDDKLIDYLVNKKIEYFRGNLNNVAKRLLDTAKFYKKDHFLRISGDSPFIDYKLIDKAIGLKKKLLIDYDIITNIYPRTFPSGMSVEIINTKSLEKYFKKFTKFEKEHVTPFFYKNHKKFKIYNFKSTTKSVKKFSIDWPYEIEQNTKNFKNLI